MNFQALKWMIDNLVQTYTCPACDSQVEDKNVEIAGTAWTNINVEIWCPWCGKHSIVRAQVFSLDFPTTQITQWQIEELKDKLQHVEWAEDKLKNIETIVNSQENSTWTINDNEIVSLNKILKSKSCTLSDIFDSKKK